MAGKQKMYRVPDANFFTLPVGKIDLPAGSAAAIGIFFNVLKVLNPEKDFYSIANDDKLGRKLQDLDLLKAMVRGKYNLCINADLKG